MQKVSAKNEIVYLALGAAAAGFLSGLLGAGGGIVLYFILGALYGRGAKENLILSSTAVMFFCVVSLFFYKGNAALDTGNILRVGLPAALGGITGAFLMTKISSDKLKKLFATVVIISGVLMLLR
ncbi:MAG: hypothetical protein E7598_01875 [Ruminococcaceae bacterium]|nr:hypothetical protein [Oscillospiraceae bacterium]